VNLTCDELRELLYDHHAGELVVERQESFRRHLDGCQNCTNYVDSYTYTVRITRQLPKCRPLPPAVEAKLRAALKECLAAGKAG